MRRSLSLRRDTIADLTPDDLTAVGGGADNSLLCATTDCIAIRNPSEIVRAIVATVCACPMSRGCTTP